MISLPTRVSSQPATHNFIEKTDIKPCLSNSDSCILTPDSCANSTQLNRTPKVMVLIPCYQEENHIGPVVRSSVSLGYDTLVVDDGSKDETSATARAAGARVLRHEINRGKGYTVGVGLQHALDLGYDAVILLDGDGQHLPTEISLFLDGLVLTQADLLIGTRMSNTKDMPFIRRQINRFMSWLLSQQIGHRISDTQCGFRLISKNAIPVALQCTSGGFSADSEILLQLALAGYSIAEIPVSTIYGDEKSKIRPVRDTLKFVKMLRHFRQQRLKLKRKNKLQSTLSSTDT